jgi:UDP-3-O-[3-hydroxymyristoyl] glucosamine N-acyltransferase
LGELAARLGRTCEGDAEFLVRGVAPIDDASAGDLAFVRSSRQAGVLETSRAGAVIVPSDLDPGPRPAIRSPNPHLDFARAVGWILPEVRPEPGVHATAVVAPDASIDSTAHVGPLAVVGARSRVGARSVIHAQATLYDDVQVGADCTIHARVVVREGVSIGDRVVLQPGAVIGGDGFGYVFGEEGVLEKVPQVGSVVIEDDAEIGANTTIDRAALGQTRIGRSVKIDNLVQVAHNCDVGDGAVIVAQSGLAGSTIVGRRAFLMAQSGAAGHLRVGDGAFVGARAGLAKDVPAGARVWGTPAMEERAWHRAMVALAKLPRALRRLRAVERRLGLEEPPREPDAR